MPLQKESYFAGSQKSKITSIIVTILGIIGATIILIGYNQTLPQVYYILGAIPLLITALYFKLTYFIALEFILIAGHSALLLHLGPVLRSILPILLTLQILVYYLLNGQLKNIFRFIGVCGIALLSLGFSYENDWIFFFGSLSVGIFALYHVFRGQLVALIWVVLNLTYAVAITLTILYRSLGGIHG